MIAYKIADIGFGFGTFVGAESDYFKTFRIDEQAFAKLKEKHLFTFPNYNVPTYDFGKKIYVGSDYSVYCTKDGFVKITERFDREKYKCLCFRRSGCLCGELIFTNNGKNA